MIDKTSDRRQPTVSGNNRWTHWTLLGGVCVLVIGFYCWSAHSALLELLGSKPADSYYNLLVQGFHAGQLNLKTETPRGLARFAAPYDPNAVLPYLRLDRNPLLDTSYYGGKFYLYFGVTPALVLFWPYAALTGHYLWHKDAVVIFFSLGFLTSAGLLWTLWRRCFAEVSSWVLLAGMLALGLANFTPVVLVRCDVYEVPISCGYMLAMVALAGIWKSLHDPSRRGWWLATASLAYGLALGARPSLLFGAVILLVPLARSWRARSEPGQAAQVWVLLLAAFGPILLLGLGLLLYNFLRFDNPFEFGQHYQLPASLSMQGSVPQFSPRYLWFNFRVAFLAPARWVGHFPFVQGILVPALPKGSDIDSVFGVLTNIPLVWLALATPLAWRSQLAEARVTLRWFLVAVVLLFGTCALTLGLHNSMCLRYEVEFAPALVLLAVMGIFGLEQSLASQPVWRRIARCGWGSLLAFSVAFNLFANFARQAEAQFFLGVASFRRAQLDQAVVHLQKALAIQPEHAGAHAILGNILARKGEVDEAVVHYQKALEIDPNDMEAHNNLGSVLSQKGRLDEAMAHFQKAIQIRPNYVEALNNLGLAFLNKGQVDEAMAHFQKAIQIRPNYVNAHNNLGAAFLNQGQVDEAISQFHEVLDIKPNDADAHNGLGVAYLRKGQVDEAIVHFRKALDIQPNNAEAHNSFGSVLLAKNCLDEAISHYREALKLKPGYVEASNNLIVVLGMKESSAKRFTAPASP